MNATPADRKGKYVKYAVIAESIATVATRDLQKSRLLGND